MDFKEYLAKRKLQEEMDMNGQQLVQAPVQEPIHGNTGMAGVVSRYVANGDMKAGLIELGKDLGEAIFDYAVNQYVTQDMFDSEDEIVKYTNTLRDKVEEGYNKTLVELLRNIGITIANTKNTICK